MNSLVPYLNFQGQAEEALSFYHSILGGTIHNIYVRDTPMAGELPPGLQDKIMHGRLVFRSGELAVTDMGRPEQFVGETRTYLLLECSSEQEVLELYQKLSEGGEGVHVPERTFWGAMYGDCWDRYGIRWMFNYQLSAPS